MLREIVLIRHGESLGNVAASAANASGSEVIEVGYRDPDVPLSPVGRQQGEALAGGLGEVLDDSAGIRVWSSPYLRALETAQAACGRAAQALPITVDDRLRDRELGILDLLTTIGVAQRFPLEAQRRQWWGKFYHRPPGGESWADVALRLRSFLRDLDDSGAERAVVFAHDAIVLITRYLCEGLDEHQLLQISAADPPRNVSITVLGRDDPLSGWRLLRYNDVRHLLDSGAPVTEHAGEPDVAH